MRHKLQKLLLENNEYVIRDPLSLNWNLFRWPNGYFRHQLSEGEIYRFELVPNYYWGVTKYCDIILLLNNVPYLFDLFPGAEIWIPKLDDVEQFILKYGVSD